MTLSYLPTLVDFTLAIQQVPSYFCVPPSGCIFLLATVMAQLGNRDSQHSSLRLTVLPLRLSPSVLWTSEELLEFWICSMVYLSFCHTLGCQLPCLEFWFWTVCLGGTGELNLGPHACEAITLPLSYSPSLDCIAGPDLLEQRLFAG